MLITSFKTSFKTSVLKSGHLPLKLCQIGKMTLFGVRVRPMAEVRRRPTDNQKLFDLRTLEAYSQTEPILGSTAFLEMMWNHYLWCFEFLHY